MATHQELSWSPARTFVAAYKENLMAADTTIRDCPKRPAWGHDQTIRSRARPS